MQPGNQRIYKAIFFTFFFCLLLNEVSTILQKKLPERTATEIRFHSEPKNSIDVLFVGSSSFYRGISPLVMWNEFGFTSYVRSTSVQSPVGLYHNLVDALDTQTPKLVVLDGIILLRKFDYINFEPHIRKSVDSKALSIRKLQLINELWQNENDLSPASFIFPIFRYHTRWKNLNQSDFYPLDFEDILDTKGQRTSQKSVVLTYPVGYMQITDYQLPISDDARLYYDRIIELCNEKSIKVLFVTLPRLSWSYPKHSSVQAYADANHLPYLDLSFPEEIAKSKIDLQKDFRDLGHLNYQGGKKASEHLGEKLIELYLLEDRRNDPDFAKWIDLYNRYEQTYLNTNGTLLDPQVDLDD